MSQGSTSLESQTVKSVEQLVDFSLAAASDRKFLGTESEKFGVFDRDGGFLAYEGNGAGIVDIFAALVSRHGWSEVREREGGPVIALRRHDDDKKTRMITLEPGGQVELSGGAVETVHEVADEHAKHLDELKDVAGAWGLRFLGTGYHPLAMREDLPWVPKERYAIMREYFPTRGTRGLDMMKRTATVQVNVDYSSEEDALRKMRVGLAITPIVTALFANSPFAEGAAHGGRSERARVWLDCDADRTGLLPCLWDPAAGLRDYVEWALDVPMYMFRRGAQVFANTGQSFRSFWQDGFEGQTASVADWQSHLATCFPEVRIKRTIELRGCDMLPEALLPAVPAFWAGILYDESSLAAAEELVQEVGLDLDTVRALRPAVAEHGLRAELPQLSVKLLGHRLVRLAMAGLERRDRRDSSGRNETCFLEPILELAARGASPADLILKRYEAADRAGGESRENLLLELCRV